MRDITFMGSTNNIEFNRKRGSKDKKKRKRKVINNRPSADGQAPLNEIGQQRTGYKYYRKRRALRFIGQLAVAGGVVGAALSVPSAVVLQNPKAMLVGAGLGAVGIGGISYLEHANSKYSPFYRKKLPVIIESGKFKVK